MKNITRRTMLAAAGAMPIAASPAAAVCAAPSNPLSDEQDSAERLRWHVEQAQALLYLMNDHLPPDRRPRIVISYWLGIE